MLLYPPVDSCVYSLTITRYTAAAVAVAVVVVVSQVVVAGLFRVVHSGVLRVGVVLVVVRVVVLAGFSQASAKVSALVAVPLRALALARSALAWVQRVTASTKLSTVAE